MPRITPRWQSPRHLRRLTQLFERIAAGEKVRALISVPPQHGKTETVLHALAWLMRRTPWLRNIYASYAANLAKTKSRLCRDYALAAGVDLRRDAKAVGQWTTPEGGGLLAAGVGGGITGNPADGVLVIDDPHKNRQEAESQVKRDQVKGWYTSTALTRKHPSCSELVVHTRWHEDDLIGWLQTEYPGAFEVLELRALADEDDPDREPGEPLWPEFWTKEALLQRQIDVGPYDWASLYDQRPRPKGGAVFGDVRFFVELPEGYRLCFGIDLAYTKKKKSDWSVAVLLAEKDGVYYVLGVTRMQARAPRFARRLRGLKTLHPGARMASYVAGTERGAVDLINDPLDDELDDEDSDDEDDDQADDSELESLGIEVMNAGADKYVRAQKTAAHWNAGKILVPDQESPFHGPWVGPFIAAIKGFTGNDGDPDDDADALVSGHDALDSDNDVTVFRRPSTR